MFASTNTCCYECSRKASVVCSQWPFDHNKHRRNTQKSHKFCAYLCGSAVCRVCKAEELFHPPLNYIKRNSTSELVKTEQLMLKSCHVYEHGETAGRLSTQASSINSKTSQLLNKYRLSSCLSQAKTTHNVGHTGGVDRLIIHCVFTKV